MRTRREVFRDMSGLRIASLKKIWALKEMLESVADFISKWAKEGRSGGRWPFI